MGRKNGSPAHSSDLPLLPLPYPKLTEHGEMTTLSLENESAVIITTSPAQRREPRHCPLAGAEQSRARRELGLGHGGRGDSELP